LHGKTLTAWFNSNSDKHIAQSSFLLAKVRPTLATGIFSNSSLVICNRMFLKSDYDSKTLN